MERRYDPGQAMGSGAFQKSNRHAYWELIAFYKKEGFRLAMYWMGTSVDQG
jgi:hypothetical protein